MRRWLFVFVVVLFLIAPGKVGAEDGSTIPPAENPPVIIPISGAYCPFPDAASEGEPSCTLVFLPTVQKGTLVTSQGGSGILPVRGDDEAHFISFPMMRKQPGMLVAEGSGAE